MSLLTFKSDYFTCLWKPPSGFLAKPEKVRMVTSHQHPCWHRAWIASLTSSLIPLPPAHTVHFSSATFTDSFSPGHALTSGVFCLLCKCFFLQKTPLVPYFLLNDASMTIIFKLQHSIFLSCLITQYKIYSTYFFVFSSPPKIT